MVPARLSLDRVGAAIGAIGDPNIAAEVGLVARRQIERDALDRNALGQFEGGDALAAALR